MKGEYVYVVSAGTYSDEHIEAIFTTKENAQSYIAKRQRPGAPCEVHDEPEAFELDPSTDTAEWQDQYGATWYVRMTFDGTVKYVRPSTGKQRFYANRADGEIREAVFADNPEHAVKIVNEHRLHWFSFEHQNQLLKEE